MAHRFYVALALALLVFGCDEVETPEDGSAADAGSSDGGEDRDAGGPADAGSSEDAGAIEDGGADEDGGILDGGLDAGEVDGGSADAGSSDAGSSDAGLMDAGADAGGACHGYTFGAPAVPIQNVGDELSWTGAGGGTIPLGTYDAVSAETTGPLSGMYRATWVFEDASTLAQLQQITLVGPGPIIPRRFGWSTGGGTLIRTETCPGTDSFSQSYRVRTDGAQTFLDVREGTTLMFTFLRR